MHTSEKKERTPHRPSISDKATEHEATAAADKISHSEDRAAAPGLAARPATEPSINPATRDPAFAGLRDPIAKPPPAPRAGPLTTAMLAPVSALPPTRFQPPPTMVDASQIAAPVEIATPNRDQPAKPAKLASINVPREIAAVAQMPSEQHGGTWFQRMLMVLGGALAAAWTTRFMVA